MGWSCSRVRRRLPLYVGGDLTGAERQPLTLHLRTCPRCHRYHAELEEALAVLRRLEPPPHQIPGGSLWPELRPIVMAGRSRLAGYRYWTVASGWATAACVIIALAIALQPHSSVRSPTMMQYVQGNLGFDPWLSRAQVEPTSDVTESQKPWPAARPRQPRPFPPAFQNRAPLGGDLRYIRYNKSAAEF